jgi:hypothetical protein
LVWLPWQQYLFSKMVFLDFSRMISPPLRGPRRYRLLGDFLLGGFSAPVNRDTSHFSYEVSRKKSPECGPAL